MPPTEIEGAAPAKINLALHVGGRRGDGLTRIASLAVFAEFGDRVRMRLNDRMTLEVIGPQKSGVPADGSNLALRAARLVAGERRAAILLDKRIPVAAGLGGGSSDAAAVLRLSGQLWNIPLPDAPSLAALGADVPVCMIGRAALVEGIGERVTPVDGIPRLDLLLVNPGTPLSTGSVFQAFNGEGIPELEPPPSGRSVSGFVEWLTAQRNDLEAAAIGQEPAVGATLARLRGCASCLLARMSGSGATCFGIFPGPRAVRQAAGAIAAEHPGWWVMPTRL